MPTYTDREREERLEVVAFDAELVGWMLSFVLLMLDCA
jgi:hypothetical protein